MRKLFVVLFAAAVALSLSMPARAEQGEHEHYEHKHHKHHKHHWWHHKHDSNSGTDTGVEQR